jgi:WD40 repeat protein
MVFWRESRHYLWVFLCILIAIHPAGALVERWNISIAGISDVASADDGSRVIVGTNTGNAMVFDQNGTLLWETRVPGTVLVGCVGNGSSFLVASREGVENNKGAVRLFDGTGNVVWFRNTGWPMALDLCQSTGRILIGDRAGNLQVINQSGGEEAIFNDFPKSYPIAALSLSGDGKYFAYTLMERNTQVRYITVSSASKKAFQKAYTATSTYADNEPVNRIVVSGDGAYVATAGGEGSHGILRLYARNGTLLWSKDTGQLTDIALSPDSSRIYTATRDGLVSCYSQSGNLSWEYSSPACIGSISLASGENLLASGSLDGDLCLFNESGTLLWHCRITDFPTGAVSRVELSDQGNALVALSNEKRIRYFVEETEPGVEAVCSEYPLENTTSILQVDDANRTLQVSDEKTSPCSLYWFPTEGFWLPELGNTFNSFQGLSLTSSGGE